MADSGPRTHSKTFAYHKPSPTGLEAITELRFLFSEVEKKIKAIVPPGREQALALTKNEECAMWAIKGVVVNDPLSVVEQP